MSDENDGSIEGVLPEAVVAVVRSVEALSPEDRIDALVECIDGVLSEEERDQLLAELSALYGDGEEDVDDEEDDEDDEDEDGGDDDEDE